MADRAQRPDPDRQGGVGPLDGVGDAPQPRLPRPGRIREDEDRGPARQADAHDPRRGVAAAAAVRADHRQECDFVAVAPLITEQSVELAQQRLVKNAHFAKRNTKELTLLQGVLVCRECGYACYRPSTRTSNKRIYYYRCIGWTTTSRRRPGLPQPPGPR